MEMCGWCGASLAGKRAGARFCSKSCRNMASRAAQRSAIPAVMRGLPRWVLWKPVKRGAHWTKLPIQLDGRAASSTDPCTWVPFEQVRRAGRKGFVLGGGIGCIDLDGCLHNGRLESWARDIIETHRREALLIEVSPSGTGVHIFLPMAQGRGTVERGARNVEIYPPDSGRYICVTGDRLK